MVRHGPKMNGNLRVSGGQPFAGAQVKRHLLPSPVVHVELDRRKRFRGRISGHAGFRTVSPDTAAFDPASAILAPDSTLMDLLRANDPNSAENIDFLLPDFIAVE